MEAVSKHGILKGTALGVSRIARCSRNYMGGPDPVPEKFSFEIIKKNRIIFKRHKNKDQF
jgi:putative component of membrane protein insertase Oxa1/YidC/SpoIIIJ protein YidD